MVYVYVEKKNLDLHIGKNLEVEKIKNTLIDMGMDLKGEKILDDKDVELKIEITAEKIDMINDIGIGRAIKYYLGYSKKVLEYDIKNSGKEIIVWKNMKNVRPFTCACIVKNIKLDDVKLNGLIELQEKIHESFGRNRKKAAIGIYPLKNIKFPVFFQAEKPENIKFVPLDCEKKMNGFEILKNIKAGKKYSNLMKDLEEFGIFKDSNNKILSMPPIINSQEMGRVNILDNDLFVEVSGHNEKLLNNILKIISTTFIEMGGKIEIVKTIYQEDGKKDYELNLDFEKYLISLKDINKIIGFEIKENEIEKYLNKIMLNLVGIENGNVEIGVPSFRCDIFSKRDIIDDIARAIGYNNIKPIFPKIESNGSILPFTKICDNVKEIMISMGFLECYTFSLTSKKYQFEKMNIKKNSLHLKLKNTCEKEINMIRVNILPELLRTLNYNRKNKYPQNIFEIGSCVYEKSDNELKSEDIQKLSVVIADLDSNYTLMKQILTSLFAKMGIVYSIKENDFDFLIEGRSGDIIVNEKKIGFIGEVSPKIINNFGLLVPISCFEIDLEMIFLKKK